MLLNVYPRRLTQLNTTHQLSWTHRYNHMAFCGYSSGWQSWNWSKFLNKPLKNLPLGIETQNRQWHALKCMPTQCYFIPDSVICNKKGNNFFPHGQWIFKVIDGTSIRFIYVHMIFTMVCFPLMYFFPQASMCSQVNLDVVGLYMYARRKFDPA